MFDSRFFAWPVFVVMTCLLAGIGFGCERRHKNGSNGQGKYRVGMSLTEAQGKMPRSYPIQEAGLAYPAGGPNTEQRAKDTTFMIDVKEERVILEFNSHREVVNVVHY